ncbi:MAG: hypothetical protein WBC71_13820 [Salaquimonas sp.]
MLKAEDAIDLKRFPIDQIETSEGRVLLNTIRQKLSTDGCAVLKGFVKPAVIDALVKEAEQARPNAHSSKGKTNPYFSQDQPDLPSDHPKRRFFNRSNSFIPADNFGDGSLLRSMYEYEPFYHFIKDALQAENFFPYADPLADVIVNMADEGEGFPWHFDTNNYTVTLAIQNAEQGGDFEYAPNIRVSDENFDAVKDVLDGRSDRVKTLTLEPGDLQIFKGRYSLHRVAPLAGETIRYVAIFSFVEKEGMVGSVERTKQLYGKVLPIHYENEGLRADDYID